MWDLSYNLVFSWNERILNLFASTDHELWRRCQENPVAFLNNIPQKTLEELARDDFFLSRLEDAKRSLDQYMSRKTGAYTFPDNKENAPVVAYFSLEYGITLSLPIYSGGLGILAGDHLKSASDLNIPLVGVGLLYREGYFRQYMTPDGWQQERYPENDFNQMPIRLIKNAEGNPVTIQVDLAGQPLTARIWEARVGRIRLLLLDTYVPENPEHFRQITSSLYGGNLEMRLWQEILLGIGGIKALAALGLEPKVIHMNEGHSAFAGLERIRSFMHEKGLSFEAAQEIAASSSVFTTHPPVPAGNARFPADLMRPYFEGYTRSLGLAYKVFLALGREDPRDDAEPFCMTVLALKLSRFNNGVSQLHGQVSRNMWKRVWPQYPSEDVPIGAITNGVHMPTWVAKDMALLFDRYLGVNWREDPDCGRVWGQAEGIPVDATTWSEIVAAGEYAKEELDRMPAGVLDEYFEPTRPGRYRVVDRIRQRVTYRRHDLLSLEAAGQAFNLIVCKNVLLHFTAEQRVDVYRMFHGALGPGGLLVTEQTQKLPPELESRFARVVADGQLYRKVEAA
jgi:starch phosphorylase